ncbi:MAG: hypothetical protein ACRCZF_15145, partial [Gemmataceae bacterium]
MRQSIVLCGVLLGLLVRPVVGQDAAQLREAYIQFTKQTPLIPHTTNWISYYKTTVNPGKGFQFVTTRSIDVHNSAKVLKWVSYDLDSNTNSRPEIGSYYYISDDIKIFGKWKTGAKRFVSATLADQLDRNPNRPGYETFAHLSVLYGVFQEMALISIEELWADPSCQFRVETRTGPTLVCQSQWGVHTFEFDPKENVPTRVIFEKAA